MRTRFWTPRFFVIIFNYHEWFFLAIYLFIHLQFSMSRSIPLHIHIHIFLNVDFQSCFFFLFRLLRCIDFLYFLFLFIYFFYCYFLPAGCSLKVVMSNNFQSFEKTHRIYKNYEPSSSSSHADSPDFPLSARPYKLSLPASLPNYILWSFKNVTYHRSYIFLKEQEKLNNCCGLVRDQK